MLIGLAGGGASLPDPQSFYPANSAVLAYTDCVAPTFVGGYARFVRPINDVAGNGYTYAMPGARLRFRSNAPTVNVLVRYNGLISRTDARNTIGAIYVNGTFVQTFQSPPPINTVAVATLTIVNGSSVDRLYEIVLPYADGVEFGGVNVDLPYVVTAAAARTGSLMVCYGDSITEGFTSTDVRVCYPFLLANLKNFRCINMGYGSLQATASHGTDIANLSPDLITVMIGTNEFLNQVAVATYQANLTAFLTNIHNINPTVPIYLTAPLLNTNSRAIPLSSYQAVPGAVRTALGYAQIVGVNPTTLLPTSAGLNADGTHPNDSGHSSIATGFASIIP